MPEEIAIEGTETRPTGAQQGRRPSWLLFWLLAPCVIGANRLAVWVAERTAVNESEAPTPPLAKPLVVVEPKSLFFGKVWESDTFRWDVEFRNVSDEVLILRDVGGTCDCTRAEKRDLHLTAKQKVSVSLVTDLLQIRGYDPAEVRPIEIGVRAKIVRHGGEVVEGRWALHGLVRRLLRFEPHQIGLGEDLICGERGRALKINISPKVRIAGMRLGRVPAGWEADLALGKGGDSDYVLRMSALKAAPGHFVDEFELVVTAEDGRQVHVPRVKVEGRVVPPVAIFPNPCDLGQHRPSGHAKGTFWVVGRGQRPIKGVDVTSKEPRTKVAAVMQEGERWRIEVVRDIGVPGAGTTEIIVRVKLHGGEQYELPLTLHWYGLGD